MNVRSIRFRLVVWYAGCLTLFFTLLSTVLFLNLRQFLERDLRLAELRRAHQVANTLLAHIPKISEDAVAAQVKDWYEPELNNRFIRISRRDGSSVYVSGKPQSGFFDPPQVSRTKDSGSTEFSEKLEVGSGKTLLVAGLFYPDKRNPQYTVEFGELLDPVETMLDHVFLQMTLAFPLAVFIITAGGYWLVRRALSPVEQITSAAEQITQHNLGERLPVAETGDELESLSNSLNHMISRLDDAFQQTNRFLADASHELRTPLTILCGELEELTNDSRLDARQRERTLSLLSEALRLSKIVEQLLMLSRLDAGEAIVEWQQFDLAELVRSTAEQMNLLAEDKNISIKGKTGEVVLIEGDRSRLKQVVVNLLDNAIKYTSPHGSITWSVRGLDKHAVLEISDTGMGIPSEAMPHIFDRFYRVDKARSADGESIGLGLAIVKSILSAHGGEVEAESRAGKGTCFRVRLPIWRPAPQGAIKSAT